MHRGGRRVVVGVAALAANQRVVFLAPHALTDAELDGSSHRISDFHNVFKQADTGSREENASKQKLKAFYIAVVRAPAQTAFGGRITAAVRQNQSAPTNFS